MKLHCYKCSKPVSTEVPDSTIVRAVLECPECIEKEPEGGFRYLDCSTGHVTKSDMELLDVHGMDNATDTMPMMSAVYPEGAWVGTMHTLEEDELKAEENNLRKLEFSEAFLKVLAFARGKDCKYVCLDCDAKIYDELKVFDW